ncbi:MAG: hypothetical protein ACLTR5_06465 [Oscillospiraceae bacterium]
MNYNFNWTVIEKNIVPMLEGLGFGLLMAIIAITIGTIIGLLLALPPSPNPKPPASWCRSLSRSSATRRS